VNEWETNTGFHVTACYCSPSFLFFVVALQASRVWVQNKVDESKHEIHSQVDAITAGTASVVNLTAGKFQREGLACSLLIIYQSNSSIMGTECEGASEKSSSK